MNYLPISLPSKCLPYEGIKPADILVRPYNGADETILAQINPLNLERNFLVVLRNVLQGMDPSKLTVGDRLYLILWQYVQSYSPEISVEQLCSHCLQTAGFPVNLMEDLAVLPLPEDYKEPCTVHLPGQDIDVQLRILTIQDEVEVEKMAAEGRETYLYRYAKSIVDGDEPFVAMEKMKAWPAKDIARIRKFHELDTRHGIDLVTKVKCPKCGEEEEIEVPFRFDFLHPTGEALGDCFRA